MEPEKSVIQSYFTLRQMIGLLGIFLPIIIIVGVLILGEEIPRSISRFYYTDMGPLFTGTVFLLGFFMFTYPGYDKFDNWISNIAAIGAVGVALVPTNPPQDDLNTMGILHYTFAILLFVCLSIISYFLFTKSNSTVIAGTSKDKRNKIYRWSSIIIALSIITIALRVPLHLPPHTILIEETIALWAFGFAWLTKGGLFFKD